MKQTKKQAKAKNRTKTLQKQRHLRQNEPAKRYRLDVWLDGWKMGVIAWSYFHQVESHRADTEARRARGEEIAEGRIVDIKTDTIVMVIEATQPKGSAPDKIADGVKAADIG